MSLFRDDTTPDPPCDGDITYGGQTIVDTRMTGEHMEHQLELLFGASDPNHPTAIVCVECGWNGKVEER